MAPTSTRSFVFGWTAVVLLFILAWVLFARGMDGVDSFETPDSIGSAAVGRPLPDLKLTGLDGRTKSLAAFRGHPLWMNFFETWCPPCKAEVPDIERHYESHRADGLVVLGVDIEEKPAQVEAFEKRFGTAYPLAIDGGAVSDAFDVQTIPVSVFVDSAGTIRAIRIGQMDSDTMDASLRKILPRSNRGE
jgi:cytochrome c biogenesis protein CcmG/thiol:disulfide interchange protein DsbE